MHHYPLARLSWPFDNRALAASWSKTGICWHYWILLWAGQETSEENRAESWGNCDNGSTSACLECTAGGSCEWVRSLLLSSSITFHYLMHDSFHGCFLACDRMPRSEYIWLEMMHMSGSLSDRAGWKWWGCRAPVRVTYRYLEDGTKVRVSTGGNASGSIIPRPAILRERRKPRSLEGGVNLSLACVCCVDH
jgi:hypothetical protein